ncbi:MAG: ribosome biogenesis GTPase Der [Bacteroidetes bacterium HGW-Bacteroidetes-6]|jgi:GTP-binding protein|nr:MAG: ribosome biogenesis GTPase Der [Bacteroidetes bacterium HGW-Bacteroidetes-6]
MGNILAIVGRPNVGKSTFFNRLVGEREAIEDATSGVTRDRHYGKSDWNGISFSVIDTGGYVHNSDDVFEGEIKRQVELAISEADAILFITDVHEGFTPMDEDVADLLRRCKKPVVMAVNKADNNKMALEIADFYSSGFGEIFAISAINGSGTGELLDEIVKSFKPETQEEESDIARIAIVGRPNAGKSSILNTLTGEERSIVTPLAGTTRDSIFTEYNKFGFNFRLVDTAGLRKRTKIDDNVEFYSTVRAIRSIENSDVCMLVVDATRGFEAQDLHILSIINQNRKGVVIVMNKWDLVEKDHKTMEQFKEMIEHKIKPQTEVPMVFTSATEKTRVIKMLELLQMVHENRRRKISTSKLNNVMLPIITETAPPMYKGKRVKIKYITQLQLAYPSFVFFCNLPQYIKEPYRRFIERKMRENFDFAGCNIMLYFREK